MYSERSKSITTSTVEIGHEIYKERQRILNHLSKPVPDDFPERLKPYWKDHLEYSLTPCQSGWLYLAEKNKHKL